MQKWYDDGYFTANLLMKRTTIDKDWTSVGELLQRAGNPRLFLTPLPTAPPPGLPRRDPLLDGPAPDGTFGSPFQPVPARALRVSAMDQFVHNGSLVPDSPSSSFSTGRFSNGSPDPAAFPGRLGGHHFSDSPATGPRLANLVGTAVESQRRATFDEGIDPTLVSRPSYTNYSQGRSSSIDGLGFHGKFMSDKRR
jgi:PERQ amino acid-rich with GYF domain-containing protein